MEGDIPMDYLRMLASQIVQNTDKVKGDKEPEKAVLLSAAPNDYAMGTPAKAKSGTASAGSTQQQLFSKASTPPQTIKVSLDAPRTIDYGEVLHTVTDLRKLEWVLIKESILCEPKGLDACFGARCGGVEGYPAP